MKKIFLLLLFISTIAQAQIVNIPDANFKARLLSATPLNTVAYGGGGYMKIDANDDGEIQLSEAVVVDSLSVVASDISSLAGITSFSNLKKLNCNSNNLNGVLDLSSLIFLREIDCGLNMITDLNLSGLVDLEYLYCNQNLLTTLNLSGISNLKYIECSLNNLTNLDVSNHLGLIELSCHVNSISTINLNGLVNLLSLGCANNQLSSLDVSNLTSLQFLNASDNLMSSINLTGANALSYLDISNNQLSVLNLTGLALLENLNCSFNDIVNLDLSGLTALVSVICNDNQILNLNFSGLLNLQEINCSSNNLTTLDFSGNPVFGSLNSSNNNLTYLNLKNGYNYYNVDTYWTNNPNLDFVCVDDSEMVIIQQIVTQSALLININSYCSFTPGGDYNTITGLVQYDFNQNGCDVLDFPANYTRIDVNLDGVSTNSSVFSNGVGVYNLYTSTTGVYNLVPNIENPSFFNVSPISADVPVMTIDNSVATQNFCITANGVHPDLEIVIAPIVPARPGFTAEYQIVYRNKGNQVMSQLYGVNFFYNQNLMSFVSATQVPSSIVSGGMSWDFANLLPFESRSINVVMQINAPTDTNPVNIGDVLQFTSSIMPMAGDEYTVDNLFQLNQTVVGSYDPNDITCIQGNIVAPSYIGEFLHYVINFENTGTAPAENVVVKIEVNPSDFDINSLRILEASHNATIKITNNILEIIFQTIMLDTGGHGNVLLKVKSKENLVLNDIVTKNAKIYFDYNFPIVTNDANTIFQALNNAIPIKDLSISLYPNPTSSLLNIKAENRIKSVELYDVQGRIIQVNKADSNEVLIDISGYNSGVYFVKVTTDFGSQIKKVVKE